MIGLIALLILTGIALRGYLPGEAQHSDEQPTSSPAAMIAVIALLAAAVAIITVAIVATLRQPRSPRPAGHQLRDSPEGDGQRPTWRFLMIALAALLVWLVIVVLLTRLGVRVDQRHSTTTTATSTPAPNATQTPPPAPPSEPDESGGDMLWPLLWATVAMGVFWAAGIVVALLHRRRGAAQQPLPADAAERLAPPPGPEPLALAAERGLAEIGDLSRDPRAAIIACYAAMEGALASAPGAVPQDSDTPSEVLARAVEHHALHAGSATELVDLFAEARFSPHVMTEAHRETAVRALELVLADRRSMA